MVYLYDEYFKANPREQRQVLNKFKDSAKNLHEMTLDELNQEVSTWRKLNPNSIGEQQRNLIRYLRWLHDSKGVNVNLDIITHIQFPILEKDYIVFSTNEIHLLWEELFIQLEQQAAIKGNHFSIKSFLVCYVAGILSFYGLTDDQLLALTLSDIQPDRVKGYENINLTPKDIEILMRYKRLTALDNGRRLIGYKYFRSITDNVSVSIFNNFLFKTSGNDYINYLTKELNYKVLYEYGVYNRIYNYEIEHGVMVQYDVKLPDWFMFFIEELLWNTEKSSVQKKNMAINLSTAYKYREKYIHYRNTRNKQIEFMSNHDYNFHDSLIQKLREKYLVKK